jgi:hypothetical protein
MLYKFKSKAAADVIMLPPHARSLLEVLGTRDADETQDSPGIVLADQIAAAMASLEQAMQREEADLQAARDEAVARGDKPPHPPSVTLRQRAHPLMVMLKRSAHEGHDVTWTV